MEKVGPEVIGVRKRTQSPRRRSRHGAAAVEMIIQHNSARAFAPRGIVEGEDERRVSVWSACQQNGQGSVGPIMRPARRLGAIYRASRDSKWYAWRLASARGRASGRLRCKPRLIAGEEPAPSVSTATAQRRHNRQACGGIKARRGLLPAHMGVFPTVSRGGMPAHGLHGRQARRQPPQGAAAATLPTCCGRVG